MACARDRAFWSGTARRGRSGFAEEALASAGRGMSAAPEALSGVEKVDAPRRRLVPCDYGWRPGSFDEATAQNLSKSWAISWYGIPARRPSAPDCVSAAVRLSFNANYCMRISPLAHSLIGMVQPVSSTCCVQEFVRSVVRHLMAVVTSISCGSATLSVSLAAKL